MTQAEAVDQLADTGGEDSQDNGDRRKPPPAKKALAGAGLAALGIVFGDIGTSPLYTLKTILGDAGGPPDRGLLLGILSLLFWTLVIIASAKYVVLAMRVDNDGEGGILALMSLIGIKHGHKPWVVAAGLFGAALIYGDGAITPAISVLSALEGLHLAIPATSAYVLPLAVAVLLALFLLQPFGTQKIGRVFGPIMLTWFVVIAVLGVGGIARHPGVLAGLSPTYAMSFLAHHGFRGFALLGGVFLCTTGAEALYADMGHFGKAPIRVSWIMVVFPALIINYAGQAALVLNDGVSGDDNAFYKLCPSFLLVPLVLLATAATIIASQAIITGAFSMTRQAIQLGWLPRLIVRQTSDEGYGQIYIGGVNWLLMVVTVALALAFKKSDNLSAAYGMAVSTTMLLTTVLLFIAMREIWGWSVALAGLVAGFFLIVDTAFFGANLLKVPDGGWIPLALAVAIYALMRVWHGGVAEIGKVLTQSTETVKEFFARIEAEKVARIDGTAVFLTRARKTAPPLLIWHVRQNRCLYRDVLVVTVITDLVPRVADADRFDIVEELPRVWRISYHCGFMERASLDEMLPALKAKGCDIDVEQRVYYVGHETIVRGKGDRRRMNVWAERVFAMMERNQAHLTDVLGLPTERVVEIGRHIEL